MAYKTGIWGEQAQKKFMENREYRLEYSRNYYRKLHPNVVVGRTHPPIVGMQGEKEAQEMMKGAIKLSKKSKVDFNWEGKLIEVKTATQNKKYIKWKFLLYRQRDFADFFLILCKDRQGTTQHIFMIPNADIKSNNLTISKNNLPFYKKYAFGQESGI